jgi:hypothetical protein
MLLSLEIFLLCWVAAAPLLGDSGFRSLSWFFSPYEAARSAGDLSIMVTNADSYAAFVTKHNDAYHHLLPGKKWGLLAVNIGLRRFRFDVHVTSEASITIERITSIPSRSEQPVQEPG